MDENKQGKSSLSIVNLIGMILLGIALTLDILSYIINFGNQSDESYNLENYMLKDKKSWVELGFQGEDDYEVYYSENGTRIVFEDGKPYILAMDKADIYNYHGVEIGGIKSEVKDAIQDSYDIITQSEEEIVCKDKNRNIWVAFGFIDGKVGTIIATTDGRQVDVGELTENMEENTEDMVGISEANNVTLEDTNEWAEDTNEWTDDTNEWTDDTSEPDYILPNSSNVRLTEADISYLSLQELNYAKNEIYARHGRIFQSLELQDYFLSKDWYNGFIEASDFDEDSLSKIEKENVKFLKDAEYSINPDGYQLDKAIN